MREIRLSGSEGGVADTGHLYPYRGWQRLQKPLGKRPGRRPAKPVGTVSHGPPPGTHAVAGHLCRFMKVPGSPNVSLPLPQGAGAASLGT